MGVRATARLILLCIGASLAFGGCRAAADAIMISRAMTATTIAEVFVEESQVRVELEIGIPDREPFRNLLPDELLREGETLPPRKERLRAFFNRDLVIRPDSGGAIRGRVVSTEIRPRIRRDEVSGEPLPAGEEEPELVLFAELLYPLGQRPETLTLSSPEGAGVGFVVYHLGLPVIDFRYLGRDEVLDLDWEDPWYSRFRNRNLRRQYDAPIQVFLYAEPYEVRAEVIARPRDLGHWLDLGLGGGSTIPVDAQPELLDRVAAFLAEHVVVNIDGAPAEGTLDRIHFLRRTLRTSTVIDPPEELELVSATLGAIFVFPTAGLPQEASLRWDLFSPRIQRIPAAATDEAGPLPTVLEPDAPVLRWQNFLRNPTVPTLVEVAAPASYTGALSVLGWLCVALLALVVAWQLAETLRGRGPGRRGLALTALLVLVAGAALGLGRLRALDDERAAKILAGLLHNIYRAFDFRDEETIYDVLERSVAGDLLTGIYLETRRGLELASQGGARAKVKDVSLVKVDAQEFGAGEGFRARCTWTVAGSVGHWGHVHQRINQYEAEIEVRPIDGAWKITRLDVIQEERL